MFNLIYIEIICMYILYAPQFVTNYEKKCLKKYTINRKIYLVSLHQLY